MVYPISRCDASRLPKFLYPPQTFKNLCLHLLTSSWIHDGYLVTRKPFAGYKVLYSPESEQYLNQETFLYTPAEKSVTLSCLNMMDPPAVYLESDLSSHCGSDMKRTKSNGEEQVRFGHWVAFG